MSDDPITRPGQISRIAASDYEFRVAMLTHASKMETWSDAHQKLDDERHAAMLRDISELKEKGVTVSSSVTNDGKELAKLNGMKIAAVAIFGGLATILGMLIAWFHK